MPWLPLLLVLLPKSAFWFVHSHQGGSPTRVLTQNTCYWPGQYTGLRTPLTLLKSGIIFWRCLMYLQHIRGVMLLLFLHKALNVSTGIGQTHRYHRLVCFTSLSSYSLCPSWYILLSNGTREANVVIQCCCQDLSKYDKLCGSCLWNSWKLLNGIVTNCSNCLYTLMCMHLIVFTEIPRILPSWISPNQNGITISPWLARSARYLDPLKRNQSNSRPRKY